MIVYEESIGDIKYVCSTDETSAELLFGHTEPYVVDLVSSDGSLTTFVI